MRDDLTRPAFPIRTGEARPLDDERGLTVREYVAVRVYAALLSSAEFRRSCEERTVSGPEQAELSARAARIYTDALLAELRGPTL